MQPVAASWSLIWSGERVRDLLRQYMEHRHTCIIDLTDNQKIKGGTIPHYG